MSMNIFEKKERRVEKCRQEVENYLIEGETVEAIYLLMEDFVAMTDRRLIMVDKTFFSTKKAVVTIPYKQITSIGLAKGGFMSFSKDVAVAIGMVSFECSMYNEADVLDFYKRLSAKIL